MSRKAAALDWIGQTQAILVEQYVRSLASLHFPVEVRERRNFIGEDNFLARLLPKKYLEDFHTTALAYFLDYGAGAESNRVLLHRFLEVIATRRPRVDTLIPSLMQGLEIEQEAKSDGWIDILLSNPRTKQAIIVENKVWAIDQSRQLPRYYWELTEQKGYEVIAVAYLSPDGHPPYTGDWTDRDLSAVRPVAISYGTLLEEWLRPATQEPRLASIHVLVSWYSQIMEHLLEVQTMTNMLKDFTAELAENPQAMKAIGDVLAQRDALQRALCIRLFEKMAPASKEIDECEPTVREDGEARYIEFDCLDRVTYVLSYEEDQYSYGFYFKGRRSNEKERDACKAILGEEAEVWTNDGFDTVFVYARRMDLSDPELHQILQASWIKYEIERVQSDTRRALEAFDQN